MLFNIWTENYRDLIQDVCVLQDSIIGEVRTLWERRRKAGGLKEMLQDVTKITQKLRFLVVEVWEPAWLYSVFDQSVLLPSISDIYSLLAATAHNTRHLCMVAQQQQARRICSDSSEGPTVLQHPGGQRNPLWQDNNTFPKGKSSYWDLKHVDQLRGLIEKIKKTSCIHV